jgi:hypothetical protein
MIGNLGEVTQVLAARGTFRPTDSMLFCAKETAKAEYEWRMNVTANVIVG